MKKSRLVRSLVVALVSFALLTACTPTSGPAGAGTTDYTRWMIIGAAVSLGTYVVSYVVRHLLHRALPTPEGVEDYRFGDDFAVDMTDGSFEVTLSGAAPPFGIYRGEPLPAARRPEGANLAFAVRGEDDGGGQILMVTVLQQEAPADTFTLVLVDAEASPSGSGAQVARLTVESLEHDPYVGEFSWTLDAASSSRVAGRFEALGLMSASGAGPVDVVGAFDVAANPAGSMTVMRR